jgi:hypothetical protein
MDIKKILKGKTISGYVFASCIIFALVSLITYAARGGDPFTKVLPAIVAVLAVGLIANIAFFFFEIPLLEFVPFICYFISFLMFAGSEANFISNVIMAIDGNTIDIAFVIVTITLLIASIVSMVCVIINPIRHIKKA